MNKEIIKILKEEQLLRTIRIKEQTISDAKKELLSLSFEHELPDIIRTNALQHPDCLSSELVHAIKLINELCINLKSNSKQQPIFVSVSLYDICLLYKKDDKFISLKKRADYKDIFEYEHFTYVSGINNIMKLL